MASSFPTTLDSWPSAGNVADLEDAIEKLEAKVGVNGSTVATSLDKRISVLEAGGGGGSASMPLTGTVITTTRQNVFQLQPSTSGVGHFSAGAVGTNFAGTYDYVFDVGYNIRNAVANEPSFSGVTIEHDFNESGYHWLEFYSEYFGRTLPTNGTITNKALTSNVATITTAAPHGLAVGDGVQVSGVDLTFDGNWTVVSVPTTTTFTYARIKSNVAPTASGGGVGRTVYRPIFFGIGRGDGQLIRTQYLAGSGGFQIMDWATRDELLNIGPNAATYYTPNLIMKSSGDRPQLVFQVGASNDLVLSSDANYLASLKLNGSGTAVMTWGQYGTQGIVGINSSDAIANLLVKGSHVDTQVLALEQFSSGQNAPLLALFDSGRSVAFGGFNRNGYLSIKKTTAPTDAELASNELTLWLDPTNGAAKLMVKAKQADGTVRTGSLALA